MTSVRLELLGKKSKILRVVDQVQKKKKKNENKMLFFETINIIGICIVLQTTSAQLYLYLNDKCKLAHSNEAGICQYVEDCPDVQKLFKEQHINPTLCGFERDKQIVCCPKEIETRFSDNTTQLDITKNTISLQSKQTILKFLLQ